MGFLASHRSKIFSTILICWLLVQLVSLFSARTGSRLESVDGRLAAIYRQSTAQRHGYAFDDPIPASVSPKQLELLRLRHLLAQPAAGRQLNASCAPYPRLEDLHFESEHFQLAHGGNLSYYLYGAYYDRRLTVAHAPVVSVLALVSRVVPPYPVTYCQIWYEDSQQPVISEVHEHRVIWIEGWGNTPKHVYPVLLSCKMPESQQQYRVPQLVSLVFEQQCARASNALSVVYEAPTLPTEGRRFAVCVKYLQYPTEDRSARLVEWLELMQLLGAERVTIYHGRLTENTTRTMRYYEQRGLLQAQPYVQLYPNGLDPAEDKLMALLNEVINFNDCLYRNMYQFDYIGGFDTDEVIMPLGTLHNWTALLQLLETLPDSTANPGCHEWVSYCFRNIYFPRYADKPQFYPDLPSHFYMLQHVERVAQHLDANSAIKCLHSTAFATALHNHFPLGWTKACGPQDVPTSLAQMQHFREPDDKQTLMHPVVDDNVWRFKDQLMQQCETAYRELGWTTQ